MRTMRGTGRVKREKSVLLMIQFSALLSEVIGGIKSSKFSRKYAFNFSQD